ncbi:MAG: ABC transporter ATP-binding protein [Roseibium sp.]
MSGDSFENRLIAARESIIRSPRRAAQDVIELAEDFAYDAKLKATAILLNSEDWQNVEDSDLARMRQEMETLVEKIVDDHNNPDPDLKKETALRFKVFDKYKNREIERRVVLDANNLTKKFVKPKEFLLKVPKLELRLGDITGVAGPNGSGKSTLFSILVGELASTSGTIHFPEFGLAGSGKTDWSTVKRKIAYVPQKLPHWYGSLEDTLRFTAASKGITGRENDKAFEHITQRLGLKGHLGYAWSELSGGFQLRFELAKALIWRPQLLILDEPLANLDVNAQHSLLQDIRSLARSYINPISVLISSQHLFEIETVADEILFLNRGKATFYNSVSKLGEDREYNTFELQCDVGYHELRTKLQDRRIIEIADLGLNYVITTELTFSGPDLLEILKANEIHPKYFRNISQSILQLFERNEVAA